MQLMARRTDWKTAAIVDRGIQLQEIFGTKLAAEYLNFHKVNMDVTIRVLTRPWERRSGPHAKGLSPINKQLSMLPH